MSYISGSQATLLADKNWRRRHSAWLLAPILGFGFFSFVGFLYCAVRVRNRRWWRIAAITAGLSVPLWVLMSLFSDPDSSEASTGENVAALYLIALWVGLVIYGVVVNREYLRWRANKSESSAWYHQTADAPGASGLAPAPDATPEAQEGTAAAPGFMGVDSNDFWARRPPAHAVPEPQSPARGRAANVDLNVATAESLVAEFGVSSTTADRIVGLREQRGGFRDLDEVVAAAGLQPHELIRMRDRATFGPFRPARPHDVDRKPPDDRRGGRILDY